MNLHKLELEQVAGRVDQFPERDIPEVAFVGRSNVGKSSLLNTMFNRKKMARTSGQPGKTQTINFYNVDQKLCLVDLPGYGYATAGKARQQKWEKVSDTYLSERKQLKCIALLVDVRHTPNQLDQMMYDYVNYIGLDCIVVATKVDKLKRSQLGKGIIQIRKKLGLGENDRIIPFSSLKKEGRDELWAELTKYARE